MSDLHDRTVERSPLKPSWRATFLGSDDEGRAANVSWGAIFAGLAVTIATLITLSFIGAALGLGLTDPTSDDPFSGVGVGLIIWGIFTFVISLAAGGFVAGVLAVKAGFLHGIAVWAASVIALIVALSMGISAIVGAAGSLLGSLGSAVGSGASSVASVAGDAVGATTEAISDELTIDTEDLGGDVEKILADTGVKELQPEYLEQQMEDAQGDVAEAAKELAVNPGEYEQILADLGETLSNRVETVGDAVDRDAIASAVAKNTDLSPEEAEKAVDNAYNGIQSLTEKSQEAIDNAQVALEEAQVEAERLVAEARQTAEDASNAAAGMAIWAFIALLLGAAVAGFSGLGGSRAVIARDTAGRVTASTIE